ncbi:MAG TPA: NAD(+)/NADH kinase [Candidatus Acidoferrales bacterium]|nr:NAD(+)/NADH kinase [Candidatus Acidoferrales bacterium]
MTLVQPKTGTVGLYVDLDRDHARSAAVEAAQVLREAGFAIALCEDQNRTLNIATPGAGVEAAVLLVTIGGDGTLLRAAQIAAPHGIPLFGVNTGRLGFLTECDGDLEMIRKLPALLHNGFTLDRRVGLAAQVGKSAHFALNDIVIRRTIPHMAPFALFVDGKDAAHVPADGIAVATPTGSTAYFLSAGGPILAPDVAAFGIVALLPHTLFTRPLVVPNSSEVVVVALSTPAAVEADGRVVDELEVGQRVTITRYAREICFARREPLNFFALLEDKLRWNAPIKDRLQ